MDRTRLERTSAQEKTLSILAYVLVFFVVIPGSYVAYKVHQSSQVPQVQRP